MLSVSLPSTWSSSALTAQSRDPTFSFTSSLSQLLMLRLAVATCGTETGLHKWTAHLLKTQTFIWGRNISYNLLEQQVSESPVIYIYMCVCVCVWFRTNCCYPTNGTFGFPRSARLGMSGACCSLLLFYRIHFCLYIPIFLIENAISMQMICSIFEVFVFLPVVFCGLGSWFC